MSKYQARIFLDRLVDLRESYRVTDHEATSMSVTDAIAYAFELFADPERLETILAESTSPVDATTN